MSKRLLFSITRKDFEIQTFRSGGPGGQNQNKVESGVRIVHRASGVAGESRSERTQWANKKLALEHLAGNKKFMAWIKIRAAEVLTGKTTDEIVDEMMQPWNIKTDVHNVDGRWVDISEQELRGE